MNPLYAQSSTRCSSLPNPQVNLQQSMNYKQPKLPWQKFMNLAICFATNIAISTLKYRSRSQPVR